MSCRLVFDESQRSFPCSASERIFANKSAPSALGVRMTEGTAKQSPSQDRGTLIAGLFRRQIESLITCLIDFSGQLSPGNMPFHSTCLNRAFSKANVTMIRWRSRQRDSVSSAESAGPFLSELRGEPKTRVMNPNCLLCNAVNLLDVLDNYAGAESCGRIRARQFLS